jgi:hypothetical protein
MRDRGAKIGEALFSLKNRNRDDMCPMETLSTGKSPEGLFELARKQLVDIRLK